MVTHDKGKTFETIIEVLEKKLKYKVYYKVLNSMAHANIPQNRERTFLICFKDEVNWKSLNKTTSMSYKFSHLFHLSRITTTHSLGHCTCLLYNLNKF